jgi:hypothetical protein
MPFCDATCRPKNTPESQPLASARAAGLPAVTQIVQAAADFAALAASTKRWSPRADVYGAEGAQINTVNV